MARASPLEDEVQCCRCGEAELRLRCDLGEAGGGTGARLAWCLVPGAGLAAGKYPHLTSLRVHSLQSSDRRRGELSSSCSIYTIYTVPAWRQLLAATARQLGSALSEDSSAGSPAATAAQAAHHHPPPTSRYLHL